MSLWQQFMNSLTTPKFPKGECFVRLSTGHTVHLYISLEEFEYRYDKALIHQVSFSVTDPETRELINLFNPYQVVYARRTND